MSRLRTQLPSTVEVLYSLKANPSLGLSGFIASHGFGADVASAGELATAMAAGFPPSRIVLTGPDKSPAVLDQLRDLPEVIVSLDSVSELELVAEQGLTNRTILRLRPDFSSFATCSAGPDSRFGLRVEELPRCRDVMRRSMSVIGFHVFSGSQVLDTGALVHHLRGGTELSLRAAAALEVSPEIIDLGGGFGIPYGPGDKEIDLSLITKELASLSERIAPTRIVMELGRYFVAQAGWYLTTVIGTQNHSGRAAVVVDGGTHQRGDICGVGLRRRGFAPVVLAENAHAEPAMPTDVLGCLSLPSDILIEAAALPPLRRGDVLAFPNAGAYGFAASPLLFHGHSPPAEAAFDDAQVHVLRGRPPVAAVLDDQSGLHAAETVP
jgi:diaminopimelate decarboxylase